MLSATVLIVQDIRATGVADDLDQTLPFPTQERIVLLNEQGVSDVQRRLSR